MLVNIPRTRDQVTRLIADLLAQAGVPRIIVQPYMSSLSKIGDAELIRVLTKVFDTVDGLRDTLDDELALEAKTLEVQPQPLQLVPSPVDSTIVESVENGNSQPG